VPLGDILPELRRIASKCGPSIASYRLRSLQILCFSRSRHVHPYTSCLTINLGNTLGDHYDFFRHNPHPKTTTKRPLIGGQPVVTLTRLKTGDGSKPEFLSAEVLPGRGMNLFQITAYVPGKGEIPPFILLHRRGCEYSRRPRRPVWHKKLLLRRSISVPFANRIIGPLSNDGKTVSFEWQGHPFTLDANWKAEAGGRAACDSRPHSGFQNR